MQQSSEIQHDITARLVLGSRIDATTYTEAATRILRWARAGESRAIYAANVHVVMEAYDDPTFREVVNNSDLNTTDGMPLVWGLRAMGVRSAQRVYGPTLMEVLCERAASEGVPIALIGGSPPTLAELQRKLHARLPRLLIAYAWSPPFRELTPAEESEMVREVERSGAALAFIGLGCPKQEKWIARLRGRLSVPMLGVGAAFDFIAGNKPQAPAALQRVGLEWLFRLVTEPRRLWRRYLHHNPRFVVLFLRQLASRRHMQVED